VSAFLPFTFALVTSIAQQAEQPEARKDHSRGLSRTALVSEADAHRFLVQATFGPTLSELRELQSMGIEAWLERQLTAPAAYDSPSDGHLTHFERTVEISMLAEPSKTWFEHGVFNWNAPSLHVGDYQYSAWLDHALGCNAPGREQIGTDQLRQRMAYTLSQFFVASPFARSTSRAEPLAVYYDLLVEHAFGNYRELLGALSTNVAIGVSLTFQGSSKFDPVVGTRPDENYAREIMQLFSIGLFELNTDGSPNRDGNPSTFPDPGEDLVSTYSQTDVEELAKVFTGWDMRGNSPYGDLRFRRTDYTSPLEFNSIFHEDEANEGGDGLVSFLGKTIALNAGADGTGLDAALDVIAAHPNVGPFLARHLITHFVTSNPSSDYILRVAQTFNDDGHGVRGNLAAVVRAVLLDREARTRPATEDHHFGLAKEPLLAFIQALRGIEVKPLDGWIGLEGTPVNGVYWFAGCMKFLGHMPIRAPSVAGFFQPEYIPVDEEFRAASLRAPSLQIQTLGVLAGFHTIVFQLFDKMEVVAIEDVAGGTVARFAAERTWKDPLVFLADFSPLVERFEFVLDGDTNGDFANLGNPVDRLRAVDDLLDHVDLVLTGRELSAPSRRALRHYLVDSTSVTITPKSKIDAVRRSILDAILLVVGSPRFHIQR
jgi:uncharacterized protein (DUF1800 family)